MPRQEHLSVRLEREEKEALERLARRENVTVGQLVRRAISALGPAPSEPAARGHVCRRAVRRGLADPRRERELQWLETHHEEASRWPGEWLVIEGDELVAHSPDYVQAVQQAHARGVRIPFAVRIPENPAAGVTMEL